MRVGICTSLDKAGLAVDAGFDYVELAVSEMMSREPWDPSVYSGLPIEACNLFFPGGAKLFHPHRLELEYLQGSEYFNALQYIGKAKLRLAEVGVTIGVVGSGNQRRCPPEISFPYHSSAEYDQWEGAESPEEALARLLCLGSEMPGNVTLAPESLERSESNVGVDCAYFSRILAKYNVGYTADAYHLLKEWDADGREGGMEIPRKAFWEEQLPHRPAHIHLAQLEGRRFPKQNDPMLVGFFQRLNELEYDQRVSLECNGLDPADYPEAIANVRSYFE